MIENFNEIGEQLKKLAPIINAFKSESVQLRIVELIFEDFSSETISEQQSTEKTGKHKPTKPVKKKTKSPAAPKKKATKTPSLKSGRPGPGKMIDMLIEEGYFSETRGAADIVKHCKNNKVFTYKNNEISVGLGRAVRSGKLKREKNDEGQFGYSIS